MKMPTNIILAGIPRSGTTLTCHLLNKLPDFVALHEPMNPSRYFGLSFEEIYKSIQIFFECQRESILKMGQAKSRSVLGFVPDNHIGKFNNSTGKREKLIDGDFIIVNKNLKNDFGLVVKHPNMFTALLDHLTNYFKCFSVIRNPLSVLLSWNSVEMNVTNGHAPAAEAFDINLSENLNSHNNKYLRQVILLDWYFHKFKSNLKHYQILRYESIITSGGRALEAIADSAKNLNEPLKSKNNSQLYDHTKKKMLGDLLLSYNGCYLDFYDKNEIFRGT